VRSARPARRELHGQILELATLQALQARVPPSVIESVMRSRLGEARQALDLDGYAVLLRSGESGRLVVAASDGLRSELVLALTTGLAATTDTTTAPRLYDDLRADPGPLAGREPAAEGSLAVLPLASVDAEPSGYVVLHSNRTAGIAADVIEVVTRSARRLGPLVDAMVDAWPPEQQSEGPISPRRELLLALDRELRRARRSKIQVSVVVVQVDALRRVLEEAGTGAGLEVLDQITDSLRRLLRATDVVGRLGGGRFAAVLCDCGQVDAHRVGDKLRSAAARLAPTAGLPVRVSVGAATWTAPEVETDELLNRAIDHLEQAIAAGGDQVIGDDGIEPGTSMAGDE